MYFFPNLTHNNPIMKYKNKVYIGQSSTICGPTEAKTVIGKKCDKRMSESHFDEVDWDKAEQKLIKLAIQEFLNKTNNKKLDAVICGDLINQNTASNFALAEFDLPAIGVFSACSSFSEGLLVGSNLILSGNYDNIIAGGTSHFYTAEKQFRTPCEYGAQRKMTAQTTVTGSGFLEVMKQKSSVAIVGATIGKVIDSGLTDVTNMGGAMAPAAADTISRHGKSGYDLILTGDLGKLGSKILNDMLPLKNHIDAGAVFFDGHDELDVHQGASGCGCIALYFITEILPKLQSGELKKVLVVATGCLISQSTGICKDSMPCIAHAVEFEYVG